MIVKFLLILNIFTFQSVRLSLDKLVQTHDNKLIKKSSVLPDNKDGITATANVTNPSTLTIDLNEWHNLYKLASKKVTTWFDEMNNQDKLLSVNNSNVVRKPTNISTGRVGVGQNTIIDRNDTNNDLSPNDFRVILSGRNEEIDTLAQKAFIALEMAAKLAKDKNLTGKSASTQLGKFQLPDELIKEFCPFYEYGRAAIGAPQGRNYLVGGNGKSATIYRTSDGSFNNPFDPYMGRSSIPFKRLLPPFYSDGIQEFRFGLDGFPLPSARKVSLLIHRWPNSKAPRSYSEFPQLSLLFTQWGQFIVHDMTLAPISKVPGSKCCDPFNEFHPNCAVIRISYDDPFYAGYGLECMEFTRSSPSFRRDCTLGPKEILNTVTSFLDASVLYGSSKRDENLLRIYYNGELRVRDKEFFHDTFDFLPLNPNGTQKGCVDEFCYFAGDVRVNENPGLTALHNLWLREHNRVARALVYHNPQWDDERIFQEAKRIVVAQYQHIIFYEYLPIVLGQKLIEIYPDLKVSLTDEYYGGYSPDVDASTSQVFSSAAFRFGHSMVASKQVYLENSHEKKASIVTDFREGYFRPRLISGHTFPQTPDNVLEGLLYQKSYIMDNYVTQELADHLYQTKPSVPGLDLSALDIQRGRDVGLQSYNEWRVWCGLKPFKSFEELETAMPLNLVEKFRSLYSSVDDIDLISAGESEYWIYDSILGPTFACIVVEQMIRSRKGDRFWYENGPANSYNAQNIITNPFSPAQLIQIKKMTMAQIICKNSPLVKEIQIKAFLGVDHHKNQIAPCELFEDIDFRYWKE